MTFSRPASPASRRLAAALLLGAACLPRAAAAQDEDLAPRARLTVTQQLSIDDGNLIGVTPLDLSLQTGTRSQILSFSASAPLRQGDPEDDNFLGVGDRQARLLYRRFVRNSSIEVQGRYVDADLERLIFFDDIIDDIVTLDGGRRADSSLRGGYAFGSQSKLGGEFNLGYLDRTYKDTSDPDLTDSNTVEGSGTIYLEPTPLIRARILASGLETDSDGGTDTRSHRFGAGASMQVNRLVNLDVELAQAHTRREDQQDGSVEESDGLSVRSSLTYLRPDGEVTLSLSSDPGTKGRRDRVRIGRSFERPGYELAIGAGLTRLDEGDPDPTFQLTYSTQPSRLSSLSASLQREAISDLDGNEAINTSLRSSYSRQLSEQSSIGISLFYRQSEVQRGDKEDARSTALDINYSHAIGRDFSVVAGLNVTRSRESGGLRDDDDEERIYVGLSRSFDFMP
ncbi:hypothetical protein [Paracoccus beibuensis]|uniref:hypothetical protein n=1 Tax=Paracoccus beibuensis TaxID=547602 RepID=UPI00223F95C8|nr:hypothetical protein [Paracoccus beibuensis]